MILFISTGVRWDSFTAQAVLVCLTVSLANQFHLISVHFKQ